LFRVLCIWWYNLYQYINTPITHLRLCLCWPDCDDSFRPATNRVKLVKFLIKGTGLTTGNCSGIHPTKSKVFHELQTFFISDQVLSSNRFSVCYLIGHKRYRTNCFLTILLIRPVLFEVFMAVYVHSQRLKKPYEPMFFKRRAKVCSTASCVLRV
jgi:hypothetical protein